MGANSTNKVFLIAALLFSCTCLAEDVQNNLPEVEKFDIDNLSFSFELSLPDLDDAYISSSPADREDGIVVGDLLVNGNSGKPIVELAKEIADGKHGKYNSLLIAHKNRLVFESYFRKGRVNLPHVQFSVTKSYVSLAIGRAIQLDYLTISDLDKPISHFLKDLEYEKLAVGTKNITLHQAMSMRSGVRVSDDKLSQIMDNSTKTKGSNIAQEFLQYSDAISPESQTFRYQNSDPRITMQILDSVVPGTADDFIRNELLSKIGISVYGWNKDINGLPIADSGSNMTSRDMLKIGTLVINEGRWNGEQLISKEFLVKATSNVAKPSETWIPDTYNYGYFWYQTEMLIGDKSYDVRFAWGAGGQRIITVKDLDLVVVITGHDSEDKIMTEVSKRILPEFVKR